MNKSLKRSAFILLVFTIFFYGFAIGFYKIFPLPQLLALKHYIETTTGTFEEQEVTAPPSSVEIYETFLQRLLIKKIQIPGFGGHGGGISTSGDLLYIISNKGTVQTFSLNSYSKIKNNIPDVPMNFSGLISSGHPYKNDFRINWFRVNGFHSEYISNETHILYVSHNAYDSSTDCITHNISKLKIELNEETVSQNNSWKTIFTANPCINPVPDSLASAVPYPGHISGGAIENFDDDHLLVSVGDYNRHGIDGADEWAMDLSNPYGKVILLNKRSGEWSIYTTGNRNLTGLYVDKNSLIWSVENGPEGGDELNILKRSNNYGWPKVSYGIWYDHSLNLSGKQPKGTHPDYQKPIFSWIPSVAPSSVTKIESSKFALWKGDLIMGTMRDQSLYRLRLDEENRVVYNERIALNHRIRDLTTLPDGKLALVTDDGYLIIIEDGGSLFQKMGTDTKQLMASLENFDQFNFGTNEETQVIPNTSPEFIYQQKCASCHNLGNDNQIGPHLNDLLNRKVGQLENYNYSRTLINDERKWDAELLKSFLVEPNVEFPGTQMQEINLSPNEIDSLIQFFLTQNSEN